MKRLVFCFIALCINSPLASAQSLVCKVIPDGEARWGNDGNPQHAKSTASIPDSDWKLGFRVTGGGCDPTPVHSGEGYGGVISIPTERDYTCKHVVSEPQGAAVRASLIACHTVVDPVDPPASFQTLDGNDIIIARRGVAFLKPLKYDYKICNTDDTNGLVIKWTDNSHHDLTNPPFLSKPLPAGSCIEFGSATSPDRATSIALQAETNNLQTGYFARYLPGTFAEIARTDTAPANPGVPPPGSHPGDAKHYVVMCEPVPAGQKKSAGDTIFVKQCQLPVPIWGHYRICFDDKYAELGNGELSVWPPTALPMVLDKSLIGVPSPSNSEDPKRNWIFPDGCRDYYDVQTAFVLVGYRPDDSNFAPGNTWDPNKVKKVHMWITSIK